MCEFGCWGGSGKQCLLILCDCRHQQLHRKAISVVQNLLASHDVDPRYQSREAKARIAALYVPLIGIVIDALPQLCIDTRPTTQEQHESTETISADDARGIDQTVAMAIAGSSVYAIPGESSASVMCHGTLLPLSSFIKLLIRFLFIFLTTFCAVCWWCITLNFTVCFLASIHHL